MDSARFADVLAGMFLGFTVTLLYLVMLAIMGHVSIWVAWSIFAPIVVASFAMTFYETRKDRKLDDDWLDEYIESNYIRVNRRWLDGKAKKVAGRAKAESEPGDSGEA